MITPNTVDAYSRYMDALFDEKEIINVSTVYQNWFGKPGFNGSKTIYSPDSEVVDIDIMRGNERIAAMVHRGVDSRHLNLQKNTVTQNFSSFSRVYPLAEELGDITGSQINKRVGGENPYEQMTRIERTRMLAREHHLEHIRRYVRLFEVLAGMSLLGGMQPALLGSANVADNWYDFRRNVSHIVSPAIPWDDPAADILGDIDAACDAGRIDGKVNFDVMFLGGNVCKVFLTDTIISRLADNRGYSLVRAGSQSFTMPAKYNDLIAGGANCIGYMITPKGRTLYIFTYNDVITDDNGDPQYLLPLTSVFLGFYGARCDRYFGPPERLPITSDELPWYQEMFGMNMMAPMIPGNIKNPGGVVTPAMFFCDAYKSGDKKKVTIRTQSAPIFATTQTDAFFTYYDVITRSS
jgi:hypothetical protein